jgi:hypothetical protein
MGANGEITLTTGELATVEFRPGDTAVLMFPNAITVERAEAIHEIWRRFRPDIKCIVLHDGARLGVIRAVEE